MDRQRKRILAALLLLAPAIVIATAYVLAPKAETPRSEPLPEGNLTERAFGVVEDGDEAHPAHGNVTLYHNGTGYLLYFRDYEARAGPNVWFHLVADPWADSAEAVEDDGVKLHVPGPGHATYRGDFVVPIPDGVDPLDYRAVLAWDRTLNDRFAVATLEPLVGA